jgi:hypothetical protein
MWFGRLDIVKTAIVVAYRTWDEWVQGMAEEGNMPIRPTALSSAAQASQKRHYDEVKCARGLPDQHDYSVRVESSLNIGFNIARLTREIRHHPHYPKMAQCSGSK